MLKRAAERKQCPYRMTLDLVNRNCLTTACMAWEVFYIYPLDENPEEFNPPQGGCSLMRYLT